MSCAIFVANRTRPSCFCMHPIRGGDASDVQRAGRLRCNAAPASVKVARVGGCSGRSANPLAREAPFQLLDAQAMGRHRLRVSTVCDVVARQKDGVEHAAQR